MTWPGDEGRRAHRRLVGGALAPRRDRDRRVASAAARVRADVGPLRQQRARPPAPLLGGRFAPRRRYRLAARRGPAPRRAPRPWLALGISLSLVFPITGRRLGLSSIAVGLALCPFIWLSIRQGRRRSLALVAAAIGAAFGVVIVSCLKPPAPSTAPTEARPARYAGEPAAPVDDRDVELTTSLRVNPSRSQVDLQLPGLMVTVWPRLELFDGSPDGFWTVFGHPTWRPAPASIVSREGKTLSAWQADGALALRVGDTGDGGASIEHVVGAGEPPRIPPRLLCLRHGARSHAPRRSVLCVLTH